jgi:hypothetical protein
MSLLLTPAFINASDDQVEPRICRTLDDRLTNDSEGINKIPAHPTTSLAMAMSILMHLVRDARIVPSQHDAIAVGCSTVTGLDRHPAQLQGIKGTEICSGWDAARRDYLERLDLSAADLERNGYALILDEDPRTKGVQEALVTAGLGDAINPKNAEPGDLIQYWMQRKNGTFGHAALCAVPMPKVEK